MPPIPPPTSSGHTTTTDTPLYWCAYDRGAPARMLVLHGGPGAHHDYLLPQLLRLGELASGYDLVFYDQRGGGRSRVTSHDPVTWRTQVADMAAVIRELELQGATVVGYSFGGLLALLYAAEATRDPTLPAPPRLVLIDPAPVSRAFRADFEREFARRQAGADVARLRQELAESGLRERDPEAYRQRNFELGVAGYFRDPADARDLTPFRVTQRVQQSVWESLGDFDLVGDGTLARIECPAFFVHGRQDPIPLASSEAAAAAMGAPLAVLEDCGHVPYVEQPEALFAAVDGYLRG
jgi:proline iminopeptidase